MAVALLAAVARLVSCVVRRWFAPLILLVTTLVPALVISSARSPYIDAKLLVILTPVVVFLGAVGALAATQNRRWVIACRRVALLRLPGRGCCSRTCTPTATRAPPRSTASRP